MRAANERASPHGQFFVFYVLKYTAYADEFWWILGNDAILGAGRVKNVFIDDRKNYYNVIWF